MPGHTADLAIKYRDKGVDDNGDNDNHVGTRTGRGGDRTD